MVALIRGTAAGEGVDHCIAFRADMDALPIQETNDVDYKSINDGKYMYCLRLLYFGFYTLDCL